MTGVFSGGASEQAPSSSVSAAPPASRLFTPQRLTPRRLTLVIEILGGAWFRAARGRPHEPHLGAIGDAVGRVLDHPVLGRETGSEFDDRSQVPSDRHGL